jgi:hypothetical protein
MLLLDVHFIGGMLLAPLIHKLSTLDKLGITLELREILSEVRLWLRLVPPHGGEGPLELLLLNLKVEVHIAAAVVVIVP